MAIPVRRGLFVPLAPAIFILLLGAGDCLGRGVLRCEKAAPPRGEAMEVAGKVFADELPPIGAVEKARLRGAARDGRTTIRLLALRVQFRPDRDPRSTGNGTFDYSAWDGATFDGPPHDREYFELHMTALRNYLESVSYGRLTVEYTVAPRDSHSAYVLPHDMGYYHDYSEDQVWFVSQVESFTRDVFAVADSTDTLDFCQYDGFVIFHAGADWQSDVLLDSPFDLPSAHIALGEPVLVNDGSCEIWNAAILPETSSQDDLTIVLNGTLAHEVGHILGLPDLYNTFNFFPAVGYWDIMDSGGRIGMSTPWGYAYGLVPAAPCAWSKEFMGWLDPVVLMDDAPGIEVKASVLRGDGYRLFKIPLTSDEYFLIENRLDDIGGDLTIAIDQERGVVLGPVDPDCPTETCPINNEYDFLLPGPGMMIYHIDNARVIPGLLPYDAVNADRHRRGVAVEEADGIMDLGDIGSFYWTGSRYDPFFAANNDSFSWDTYPSTDNNLGGKTYVSVTRVSAPDSIMTADVRFDRWKDGWPIDIGEPVGRIAPRVVDLDGDGAREIVVAARSGNIYAWHADGSPVIVLCGALGRFASVPGGMSTTPAVADLDGDGEMEVIATSDAGYLYAWTCDDTDHDGVADPFSPLYPVSIDGPASSAPIVSDFDGAAGLEIAVASQGGYLTVVDRLGEPVGTSPYSFGHLALDHVTLAAGDLDGDALSEIVMSTTNRGWVVALNADGTAVPGWPVMVGSWLRETAGVLVGDLDRAPDARPEVVAVGSNGEIHAFDRRGIELPGWPVALGTRVAARAALADLDADGSLELVIPTGADRVSALRANGTRVENWPLALDRGDSVAVTRSSPTVGDIDDDGDLDILVGGPGGNLYAWDALSGDRIPGWPLSSDPVAGSAWIGDADGDGELDLLATGDGGRVLFYRLPYSYEPGNVVWETEAGAASGVGCYADSLLLEPPAETEGLLVPDGTYCYPNPAERSDVTVRVFLDEPAEIVVEIMDVAGETVERRTLEGAPSVNETVWDTSRIASGLYIVRVEARVSAGGLFDPIGNRGRSEVKIMKVAVVR